MTDSSIEALLATVDTVYILVDGVFSYIQEEDDSDFKLTADENLQSDASTR